MASSRQLRGARRSSTVVTNWKLEDAENQFSRLVRPAKRQPQVANRYVRELTVVLRPNLRFTQLLDRTASPEARPGGLSVLATGCLRHGHDVNHWTVVRLPQNLNGTVPPSAEPHLCSSRRYVLRTIFRGWRKSSSGST